MHKEKATKQVVEMVLFFKSCLFIIYNGLLKCIKDFFSKSTDFVSKKIVSAVKKYDLKSEKQINLSRVLINPRHLTHVV